MTKVILESWREGLGKVALTKLQIEMLNLSLKESKKNVDSLLDNNQIVIEIDDNNLAREFYNTAEKIGVNCKLIIFPAEKDF